MKKALSLLVAFAFLQTQTWALSGGPVYTRLGAPNMAGVYSGVLVQKSAKFGEDFGINSGSVENLDSTAGNIGVYSVTLPPNGINTVSRIVLFINGTVFSGTVTGIADPDKSRFDGIIEATANQTFTDQNGNAVDPVAQGQMRTKITESRLTPLPGRTSLSNGVAARMTGSATIDASVFTDINFAPIPLVQAKYSVSGFRQTTTVLP